MGEDRDVVPRHSVYYSIPEDGGDVDDICKYLTSDNGLT